jgi:hypothetical protein
MQPAPGPLATDINILCKYKVYGADVKFIAHLQLLCTIFRIEIFIGIPLRMLEHF